MAEPAKKKSLSMEERVKEILKGSQAFHHSGGKAFKERVEYWEKWQDPESKDYLTLVDHATAIASGDDDHKVPGAYHAAYKVLDQHAPELDDKIKDTDKLAEILEAYVDDFLGKVLGEENYKKRIKQLEEEGFGKEKLREQKGQLMSRYYQDEDHKGINVLSEHYLIELKGKKKADLKNKLKKIAEGTARGYASQLLNRASGEVLHEGDEVEMAEYVTPQFRAARWKPRTPHAAQTIHELAAHYGALLRNDSESLQKERYKVIKKGEEKKD